MIYTNKITNHKLENVTTKEKVAKNSMPALYWKRMRPENTPQNSILNMWK